MTSPVYAKIELRERVAIDQRRMRRTEDGYLVATPRVARTGIQEYFDYELGLGNEGKLLRMMRPEETVFDETSMKSYAHRPVTLDHPEEFVDSTNWKDVAIGLTGDEVMRDGEYVRVPLVLMDEETIQKVESGEVHELSLGYHMRVDATPGDGYDVIARDIRANHLSIVDQARGGPQLTLRGGDAGMPNPTGGASPLTAMTVDGITVQVADNSTAQIITKHINDLEAKATADAKQVSDAGEKIAQLEKDIAAKDAEIETLKKEVEDSKMTPERLDTLAADHAKAAQVAEAICGKDYKRDGKSTADIRKDVVGRKLGDIAKGWTDEQVAASFNTIAASVDAGGTDAPSGGTFQFNPMGDASNNSNKRGYAGYVDRLSNQWKNPGAAPEQARAGGAG